MAAFSDEAKTGNEDRKQTMASVHLTAPAFELPTQGLPERPEASDDELRAGAEALSAAWQMLTPVAGSGSGLPDRLKRLAVRLKERLRVAKDRVPAGEAGKELTPQLELLESSRMLEAVLVAADAAKETFARLPRLRLKTGEELPRVIELAEGYLVSAKGIWSAESLTVYVQQAQRQLNQRIAEYQAHRRQADKKQQVVVSPEWNFLRRPQIGRRRLRSHFRRPGLRRHGIRLPQPRLLLVAHASFSMSAAASSGIISS